MSFGHGVYDIQRIEVERETVDFICTLVRALDPQYVIETGCYHGTTAKAIGQALHNGHLDTMDIDEYSIGIARQRCVGLPVHVHHASSAEFKPLQQINLAFLDSDVGDTRLEEMEHFRPYMAPQGLVLMHDARDLWHPIEGWRWVQLPTPRGLLIAQVDA